MADRNTPGSAPSMSHIDALETAAAILNLKPRERFVLRNCLWARSLVPNGYFLTTPNTFPSVERLVAKGYISKAVSQPQPFNPKGFGLVIVLEPENWRRLIEDAMQVQRSRQEAPQ